ncbi:MAG: hypothetical protein SWI22_04650 [Pseudomonadota bacterium]|nr:hypothetical protein [Pseudomonadota bacterium]
MDTVSNTPAPGPAGWVAAAGLPVDDAEVLRVARMFAVTPGAARLAVTRVGTGFRELQRELGGRR